MKYKFLTKFNIIFLSVSMVLLTLLSLMLYLYKVSAIFVVCIWVLYLAPVLAYMIIDFKRKKVFYSEIIATADELEEKYLLPNIIEEPDFEEGKLLYSLMLDSSKSMMEQVNKHKQAQTEYREYIEQWVHEIKTPIAAITLLLETEGNSKVISEELTYIDNYIQQVLYYARSKNPEKDFYVKKFDLSLAVEQIIKKNARRFIANKVHLNYIPTHVFVFADSKWVSYILEQILTNAIKYTTDFGKKISIYGEESAGRYLLTIEDNGIGISPRDLPRVFDKGFTGENGRKYGSATGMGLYLCKLMCDKLLINITVESQVGKGTKVCLSFPCNGIMYE